jgi:hypothetical protein
MVLEAQDKYRTIAATVIGGITVALISAKIIVEYRRNAERAFSIVEFVCPL